MRVLRMILVFSFLIQGLYACKDLNGNEIKVSQKIDKVFSFSPMSTAILYALVPDKIVGLNYKFYEEEKRFLKKSFYNLPILGGVFGGKSQANIETILKIHPDIVFSWDAVKDISKNIDKALESFNIPIVYLKQDKLEDLISAIKIAGSCLNEEQRAQKLAKKAEQNLKLVRDNAKRIKKAKTVYFADGKDGLKTECKRNVRSDVVDVAGGLNVYDCTNLNKNTAKRQSVSIEELYEKDPDVIFVRREKFFDEIYQLPHWQKLRAVQNKEVYFVPISPFSWASRPPSYMRFLGIVWMQKVLYPDEFDIDLNKEIKEFYALFLNVNLSDEDIKILLKAK